MSADPKKLFNRAKSAVKSCSGCAKRRAAIKSIIGRKANAVGRMLKKKES